MAAMVSLKKITFMADMLVVFLLFQCSSHSVSRVPDLRRILEGGGRRYIEIIIRFKERCVETFDDLR